MLLNLTCNSYLPSAARHPLSRLRVRIVSSGLSGESIKNVLVFFSKHAKVSMFICEFTTPLQMFVPA